MKTEFYAMEYEAWDQGTNRLTIEEEGSYLRLCHQMYRVRGPIENWSFVTLGGMWRCHPNKARSLLGQLEVKGKIGRTPEGHLVNTRVTHELHHMDTLRTRKVDAGRRGGIASGDVRAKPLKSHDANEAPASIDAKQTEGLLPQNEPPDLTGPDIPDSVEAAQPEAAPPATKRGTRLRIDWAPSAGDLLYAASKGLSATDIAREAEKFKNHWLSKPGKEGCKIRWDLTWQNWVLGAHQVRPAPGAVVAFKPRPPAQVRLDIPALSDGDWLKHLNAFNSRNEWDRAILGPTPLERGCGAPRKLFAAAGLKQPGPVMNFGGGVKRPWNEADQVRPPSIPPDRLEDTP